MKAQPKKALLGILGLGSRSTLFYIDKLNRQYNECNVAYSTCPFLLYNTDFSLLNPFLPNNFEKLIPQLTTYLNELTDLGVTQLLIPNITLHETLDKIECKLSVIHPIDIAISKLKEMNKTEAVVFGSHYTMTSDYLKNKFVEQNITLVSPTKDELVLIDKVRQQVYSGEDNSQEIKEYYELIKSYASRSTIILACTELSIINSEPPTQVLDMALCQIGRAIDLT